MVLARLQLVCCNVPWRENEAHGGETLEHKGRKVKPLSTEEAMKNPALADAIKADDARRSKRPAPILKAAIEGTLKGPSAAQEARSMIQGVNPAYPLPKAKGRTRRVPGQMNKMEQQYAAHLETQKLGGRILEYYYEPLALKLAPKTFWHPDFLVLTAGHFIELHECKGFMEDHANAKLKVAAAKFWWMTVYLVRKLSTKDGGGFKIVEVKAA